MTPLRCLTQHGPRSRTRASLDPRHQTHILEPCHPQAPHQLGQRGAIGSGIHPQQQNRLCRVTQRRTTIRLFGRRQSL